MFVASCWLMDLWDSSVCLIVDIFWQIGVAVNIICIVSIIVGSRDVRSQVMTAFESRSYLEACLWGVAQPVTSVTANLFVETKSRMSGRGGGVSGGGSFSVGHVFSLTKSHQRNG